MVIRNIDKEFQINTDFLNSIDFTPFLNNYRTLGQMMCAIEEMYNNTIMPSELEGEIFNYYSIEDFKNYLEQRYSNICFYHINDYLIDYRKGE